MGKFLAKEVYVEIDGVDLSDHAFSIDTPSTKERVDVSGFNVFGTRESLLGLREDQVTIGFLQDYASGKVHQTIYPLYKNDEAFRVRVRHLKSQPVSAANPQLTGYCLCEEYNGLSAELNARAELSITFPTASGSQLVWSDT